MATRFSQCVLSADEGHEPKRQFHSNLVEWISPHTEWVEGTSSEEPSLRDEPSIRPFRAAFEKLDQLNRTRSDI
jgi:hypothetical protein